jgi:hypothetical protein
MDPFYTIPPPCGAPLRRWVLASRSPRFFERIWRPFFLAHAKPARPPARLDTQRLGDERMDGDSELAKFSALSLASPE